MTERIRKISLLLVALMVALAIPAAASAHAKATSADTKAASVSDNWSGYAVHRTGVSFRSVTATWTQPSAVCTDREPTFSAFWVGLGGYSLSSDALEQIGTEADCRSNGSQSLSAWYELVPAASRVIRLKVMAGDRITATVDVIGNLVTVRLADKTRHESFSKTVTDHTIDVSSAEWIAEAPSECFTATRCQTLPLTDFGSVNFEDAEAKTTTGRTGSISSPLWQRTKIVLGTSGPTYVYDSRATSTMASPSPLTGSGRIFTVTYTGTTGTQPSGTTVAQPSGTASAAPSYGAHGSVRGSIGRGKRLVEGVGAGPG